MTSDERRTDPSGLAPPSLPPGYLLANRLSSSTWVRTYDLTAVTAETDPSGASLTMTMALSGTQSGDITISVTDANAAADQSPAMIKVRLLGGWRVA